MIVVIFVIRFLTPVRTENVKHDLYMDFTPLARPWFTARARRTDRWAADTEEIQRRLLGRLLRHARHTETGVRHAFAEMARGCDSYTLFRDRVPTMAYEDIRADVMRMVAGERDVLWPGVCRDYAQSSGTSGGRSKYIPITPDSLRLNHYAGASDAVAHYLRHNPASRMFSGKAFILGGSFATRLETVDPRVRVGDLSATLISKTPWPVSEFRIPGRDVALMPDWQAKLPALALAAAHAHVTNISGVPSWFLTVIRRICADAGAERISDVWPDLEVFFHGGISFEPYREEYRRLTDPAKMHFVETYNASEGFFATQTDPSERDMALIIDAGVFYEFIPVGGGDPHPIWEVSEDEVYELVITAANGLWRYRLGDTVRVTRTAPVKVVIAGRTSSFINAFGEELMEDNANRAIARACSATGAQVANYTAAPVFAAEGRRGRHQWLIEWGHRPADTAAFTRELDTALQDLNSDYAAKRAGTIFLDPPEVTEAVPGLFDRWLASTGSHKLGGQRKVPRLANDRHIIDGMLRFNT